MNLLQDIRYGVRMLRKSPAFTAVVVSVLALGIGANTTVFTLVNAVLVRPLPFKHGERIVFLTSRDVKRGERQNSGVSWPDFRDWRAQAKSFSGLAFWTQTGIGLADRETTPERYQGARITSNMFSLVGQAPLLGRDLAAEDEKPGAPAVALIGYSIWKNRYGGRAGIIGQKVRINEIPTTIVGVMPPDFKFPVNEEIWISATPQADWEKRDNRFGLVFGRLAEGANMLAARAELDLIGARLEQQYPKTNRNMAIGLKTANEQFNGGPIRILFLAMLGAVGFVLLIACANVANLLLARSVSRAKEISIRVALGAGRWTVVRQLLIESILLGFCGGALGLGLAMAGVHAFDMAVANVGKPYWIQFSMDFTVFAYVAGVCLVTGLIFGIVPALHATRLDINERLKEGGRNSSGSARTRYLASAFAISEIALAIVLMAGAGLMVRSMFKLYEIQMGASNPKNVLTMRLNLLKQKYPDATARLKFYDELMPRLASVPGVESVAFTSALPVGGSWDWDFQLEGQPQAEKGKRPVVGGVIVTPGYFKSIGGAVIRGRAFNGQDGTTGHTAAIVNQRFVAKYWPKEDPIGKRVRLIKEDEPEQSWLTVVGVAPDIRQNDFMEADLAPVLYVPLRQDATGWINIMARTTVPPAGVAPAFRSLIQAVDADLPAFDVLTLEEKFAQQRWGFRVFGSVFVIFAVFALLLAAVGIYSVVAYSVNQRTAEIGIRVALGASTMNVVRLVLSQGVPQLAIGLAVGLSGAFALTRTIKAILVQVSPADPLTFGLAALTLILAAALAYTIPARRAARIDPVVALRYE
jgi:predicted permease